MLGWLDSSMPDARVWLDCDLDGSFKHLYWQGEKTQETLYGKDLFINGISRTPNRPLDIDEEFKNRSRVYETNGTLELWNLKPSDTMYYKCVQFTEDTTIKSLYHLNVTGEALCF